MTIGLRIKLIFSGVWDFLYPFIKVFLSKAGQILAQTALDAVIMVAQDHTIINSDEKRKAAFDRIVNDLASKGIELGTSVINSAIEAAVQKLKEEQEKEDSN